MPLRRCADIIIILTVAIILTASPAKADVVTLGPSRDNTLFEDPAGNLSNGSGPHLFIGRTSLGGGDLIRRAVLAFDIASNVPQGATINNVSLTLSMSRTIAGAHPATLHRLTADWGEGASDAGSPGGTGAPSAPGDATWIHRFYNTDTWATPGGDFAPIASADTSVGDFGSYVWSGQGLVDDVQAWLDQPSNNHGWVLRGDESADTTAKRFDSREHPTPGVRPILEIDYTPSVVPPSAVPAASNWSVAFFIAAAAVLTVGRERSRRVV